MSAPKPLHPEITYAQRSSDSDPAKNIIFFTINVPNLETEYNLDLTEDQISFSAKSGDVAQGIPEKEWSFDLDLWGKIVPAETKKVFNSRALMLILRKKELGTEYWPRLTKEKPNRNWIKTDFSKWVDEDEQNPEVNDADQYGGMPMDMGDMGGMGGMPGMGGMGGMPGMGGMGGMPGMGGMGGGQPNMEELMAQLGAMGGGAGGAGGAPDFAKLMAQMGQGGAGADLGDDDDFDDDVDVEAPSAKDAAAKADEPEIEEVA